MHNPCALKGKVPSSNVLRFLKAQSETQCFFTPNPRTRICFNDNNAPQQPLRMVNQASTLRSWRNRKLSTTARRLATVEASLFNIDLLWPRVHRGAQATSTRLPKPGTITSKLPRPSSNLSRYASTDTRPWLQRLLALKGGKKDEKHHPEGASPLSSFLGDGNEGSGPSFGRSVSGKVSNDLKLRCTEFDENGNVTLVNGEFKKSELIAKYGLLPRDLRKIDSSLLPLILVRPSAILINLLHLRVLIKHNRVLVFDIFGSTDSYTQSVFMYDLEGKLRQREPLRQAGGLPYEFRALEAVLISVTSGLEGEFEGVREPVVRVLRELEEDIDRDKLRHLLIFSKKLGTFEQKAKLVRDSIDELLDADDDLAAMYLTEKAEGKGRGETEHTEIEMLLESYHKVCDEIVQSSGNLVSNIRNTEEMYASSFPHRPCNHQKETIANELQRRVKAILDANRNSLMLLDLKFSIGTLGIGSGAFIAALYGMNLKNFMEESDLGFFAVTTWSFVFAAVVCAYGLVKLRKVQRVSMWGERGAGRRGSWRDVDPLPALGRIEPRERARKMSQARRGAGGEGRGLGEPLPPVIKENVRR
ncbi:MAG: magnesium ion transporter [Piccolia ochrophora]|nr:MAG: magnesium ion transporter [Piccolia ochrophora]